MFGIVHRVGACMRAGWAENGRISRRELLQYNYIQVLGQQLSSVKRVQAMVAIFVLADTVVHFAGRVLEHAAGQVLVLYHGQFQGRAAEACVEVCVDRTAHALYDHKVAAHRGVCQDGWDSPQVQTGAGVPVSAHIEAWLPALHPRPPM
jgi:hypothetical protein